ncbi:MAG TPA: IPT/TIG domain-containing protein, partial [Polyangiaceae bacterium]
APSSALAGSGDTALTISGTSFEDHAAVYFDGSLLTVGSIAPTAITTVIPSALLKASGSHNVSVVNGAPGGGTSSSLSFTVTNPNVTIASVSPSTAIVGDAAKSLTVTGSGFVAATAVAFNGTTLTSSFVDGSHLTATLPATSLTNAGNFSVVVTNPAPGGGVSSPFSFQVQNPGPAITSLSPNTVYYGATNTTVTVTGTGFVPSSVVKIGSSSLTTTYVSSTSLTAVVPATAFASASSVSLTVVSPTPGGGISNASTITITCDATNVDVPLGAVGTLTTKSTFYSGYVDHVMSASCPLTALSDSSHQEPVDSFVVQNTTSSPIVLSAWAVCTTTGGVQSDAYLAFYRGGTAPADDAARMQCAAGTVVSEGALGDAGNYTSPDANGSNWCPGLTKANGSGLTLAACEKAVVQITPYSTSSTTNYPAPTQIRFKPEAP